MLRGKITRFRSLTSFDAVSLYLKVKECRCRCSYVRCSSWLSYRFHVLRGPTQSCNPYCRSNFEEALPSTGATSASRPVSDGVGDGATASKDGAGHEVSSRLWIDRSDEQACLLAVCWVVVGETGTKSNRVKVNVVTSAARYHAPPW